MGKILKQEWNTNGTEPIMLLSVRLFEQIWMKLLLKKLNSSPSLPACSFSPNSKQFLRVLALGCNVSAADYPRFVQDLAEERQGMSLVYTHHQDSLRSGSSYQSPSHVSLRNNLQVCGWVFMYLCVCFMHLYVCVCVCVCTIILQEFYIKWFSYSPF